MLLFCNVFLDKKIKFLEKADQGSGKSGTKKADRPLVFGKCFLSLSFFVLESLGKRLKKTLI